MNHYIYYLTIFDTAPDANLNTFPKVEVWTAVAETETEAQRKIVEDLWDLSINGTCAMHSKDEDSPDRFRIVFGKDPVVRPVEPDPESGDWRYADEIPIDN